MTDLELTINFWEVLLELRSGSLDTTFINQVEQTIKFLKELKQLKGE